MITAAVIVLSIWVVGIPLALALHPAARPLTLIGEAWLLACGWISFVMLGLSLANVPWSPVVCATPVLAPVLLIVPFVFRARSTAAPAEDHGQSHRHIVLAARLVDSLTIVAMSGFAIFATLAPIWAWDFWAIWGLKSRTFFEHRGIDWSFLARPDNAFAHPDYPVLIPLVQDFDAVMRGGWDDRWMGLIYVAFGLAILAIVRDFLAHESGSALVSAVSTLAITGIAVSTWIGMAEGALIAYIGAAVLLVREGLRRDDPALLRMGAVMAGLAACTKNEGLTFVVAMIVGAAVAARGRRRLLLNLIPAIALPLPWLVTERVYGLHSYFQQGSLVDRVAGRIANPQEIFVALATNVPNRPLFWITAVATILLLIRAALRSERFAVVTIALQVMFYVAAFLATPFSVRWHVETSWVRLLNQIAVPLMFVTIALLLPRLGLRRDREAG